MTEPAVTEPAVITGFVGGRDMTASLSVDVPLAVRINRIGPRRQRCTACHQRRVVYCIEVSSLPAQTLWPWARSVHRCASCWGFRENTR